MTGLPKITVVTPVYNPEKSVGIAVDSILSQTFSDFELLVIDPGECSESFGCGFAAVGTRRHLRLAARLASSCALAPALRRD